MSKVFTEVVSPALLGDNASCVGGSKTLLKEIRSSFETAATQRFSIVASTSTNVAELRWSPEKECGGTMTPLLLMMANTIIDGSQTVEIFCASL